MRVVKELDAGPMFAKATRPIGPDETSDVVEGRSPSIGAGLLITVLDQIADGNRARGAAGRRAVRRMRRG